MNDDVRRALEQWKQHNPPLVVAEQVDTPQRQGSVYRIHCPFHDDRDPSMAVYDDGFHCFGCGWHGDTADFIMAVNGWGFRQFIDYIAGFQPDPRPIRRAVPAPKRDRPALDPALLEKWQRGLGERELAYWRKQGIPASTLYAYRVGWTGRRYAIPWLYRGVFTACKLRRDDDVTPGLEPKYISLKGSRYAAPYNIDEVLLKPYIPDPLLIVEDEKSVWAAERYGLAAIAAPAGSFKAEWAELICHIPNVVIVADWDDNEAGLRSAERIQGIIRRGRIVIAAAYYPDGRRVKDLHDVHMALRGDGFDMREWLEI